MITTMKFAVTGQRIELTKPVMLVAGTVHIYTAEFAFDSAWDGYTKTAVFRGGDVERERLLTDDACTVPWEVLVAGKHLRVGVYGTKDDILLPTIWTERTQYINAGAGPTEEAAEPSPTLVEQLTAKVGNLDALKTEDKSSVVAAINEIYGTGGGSGVSVTDAAINDDGHLIITLSSGKAIDAGYAVGPTGATGDAGKDGKDGATGADGKDGADGVTPTIGANGNWYLGDNDTGNPSRGEAGPSGTDGKSAYQYAQDGGYTGTEAEFADKLAAEIPAVDSELSNTSENPVQNKVIKSALDALSASVEPAENDIPKVFFGGALQQTKDAAVVPFRYISKTQDIAGYAEIKAQGNSSMSYPKKNQTVKLFKDAECTEKLKVDFKGWGKQNKHVYKANWIDLTHARNVVSARLWADMVKSRSNYEELPEELRTSPNQGAVDGFPVKVYASGVYQGRYTLNIPKDKWMANMDDSLETHCILCGENYASGCFRAAASINGNDWTDEIHDTVPDAIKTRWNEVISFVMNSTDDEFKANLGNYFDIPSLIDYHLFGLQSCGLDAYGKNQLYLTYDGQKWIASMYDMDSTWGLYFSGTIISASYSRESYEDMKRDGNLLYIRLEQLFYEELQSRWAELKNGALSIENIINRFERFTDIAPSELVKEDYASTTGGGAFTGIPSQSSNNIQQIRAFALERQAWTDEYVQGLTPVESVPCTGIFLSVSELTFTETEDQSLTATVTPDGCTDLITWESSDTNVATVTNGVVTPVASGSCTITAICGEYSATCAVSVDIGSEKPVTLPEGVAYSLTSEQTFNGTSDYIDTGVMLFDANKDFSVFIDFTPEVITKSNINLFNCQKEQSPYPGINIGTFYDTNNSNAVTYRIGGIGTGISFPLLGESTARYKVYIAKDATNGTIIAKLYSNGELLLDASRDYTTMYNTIFEQNALLGAWQDTSGNVGRYWKGSIHNCGIWERLLTDEEVSSMLTS